MKDLSNHQTKLTKETMSETYAEVRFFKWQKSDKSVSLRARSGSYGGGSEVLVIVPIQSELCAQETSKVSETNMFLKES